MNTLHIEPGGLYFAAQALASMMALLAAPVLFYARSRAEARWRSEFALRQKAETAVLEAERESKLLREVLPQMLWFNDPEGNVEFFNRRWYDYTGRSEQSVLQWGWQLAIHPDDLLNVVSRWRHALETGEPHEVECRVRGYDGTYRWFLARGLPLRDSEGKITRWFGSYTDIEKMKEAEAKIRSLSYDLERKVAERTTDLRTANEALMEARMRLQTVLDSATEVAIIALDRRGVIQLFNQGAERMLQYQLSDVIHLHTPHLFLTPAECELRAKELTEYTGRTVFRQEIFNSANLPGEAYSRESVLLRSDGNSVIVSETFTPMLDTYGRRTGTLCVAVDVTERRQLDSQLQELNAKLVKKSEDAENANRAKSDFLAHMSHEIRTPMNAILGMADLLWDSDLDPTQRHYVKVFRRAGANLLTLVNDILDLAKIESGHFELESIDFDLPELVERTIEMMQAKAQSKKIKLLSRIAPGTPSNLVGDHSRLQQILINLLGNAVKFTSEGEIVLAISEDAYNPGRLHFEVSDTGIGIPADKLESIFEDFTQAERSTTRRYGGTGLGLGICRRLVAKMGGKLSVRSEIGKGSTFSFDALFEQTFHPKPRRSDAARGLLGHKVLIVDNNSTNRLIFAEMCSSWGMITEQCADSVSALKLLTGTEHPVTFDLIIMDRLMPGLDGFELTSRLRRASVKTPILMTTSDNIPGDETRGQLLGVSGYTVKPVRGEELLRLVCKALHQPACQAPDSSGEEPSEALPEETAGGKILVAEDSEDNRLLFEAYFAGTPYDVVYVDNGETATEMAASHTFDLILMDMQMPVMDGMVATCKIRAMEKESGRSPIPVLALTANARHEDVEASRAAGCNAHLSKPISKPRFLNTVHEYISRS